MTAPMAARASFGPVHFAVAFLATEAFKVNIIRIITRSSQFSIITKDIIFNYIHHKKVTTTVYFAFGNFSAALQLLFILDFRSVKIIGEKDGNDDDDSVVENLNAFFCSFSTGANKLNKME